MKLQRLMAAWVVALAVGFGLSSVAVTAASAAGSATGPAAAAKAKPKAKHKKKKKHAKLTRAQKLEQALKKCSKDKKAKKKACEAAALKKYGKAKTVTKTVTTPGPTTTTPGAATTTPGPTVTVTNTVKGKTPEEEHAEQVAKEEQALKTPGKTPPETVEKGATKAIESASEIPAAPEFSLEQMDAYSSGNWLTSQGGNSGDRYSLLSEINKSNVANLKPNWMTQLDGSAATSTYGGEAPAAEYEGVLYYATGAGDVFAVSVVSGKILWVHKGEIATFSSDISVCCDRDSRGVTVNGGLVYVGLVNGGLEALSMKTGQLVWYAEVGFATEGYAITAAPLYYDGLIFVGPTGSEHDVRGFMAAYNAKTGALVWKKYNIPGPGEYGHNSWPEGTSCFACNNAWATGGGATWQAPVVDPETGDIIYPTANAASVFGGDYFGQNRAGANLWTDSILARHPLTGELDWGYQTTHHDIWDYDNSTSAVMINTEIGGKKVTGVAQGSKNSFPYYLEAGTGQPMTGGSHLGIEEKSVPQSAVQQTYPTQPIPKMAPLDRQVATKEEIEEAYAAINTTTNQGKTGGVPKVTNGGYPCPTNQNICPKGHDVFQVWGNFPEPEVVTGQGGNSGDRQGEPAYNKKLGIWYTCSSQELEVMDINALSFATEERFATASNRLIGYINAYNMKTGELMWTKETPFECYAGFLTTSGELLFTTTATGQFVAYDASTGAELWEFGSGSGEHGEFGKAAQFTEHELIEGELGHQGEFSHEANVKLRETAFKGGTPGLGAGGAASAIAFEFGGKEYLVVYAGGGTLGSLVPGDNLWEFSLTGSGAQQPIKEGQTPPPEHELCEAGTGCNGY